MKMFSRGCTLTFRPPRSRSALQLAGASYKDYKMFSSDTLQKAYEDILEKQLIFVPIVMVQKTV